MAEKPKPGVNAVKAAHAFAGVPVDRARCSCGWESKMRVGRVEVGRSVHRSHRDEVVAAWRAQP